MKKVLQARVNVLIEINRQLQQKREKQRLLRLKQKNSFSLYEEPSKNIQSLPRYSKTNQQQGNPSSYQQYAACGIDQIYEKRFQEVQAKKYQQIPIEELLKERRYYHKIIQNLTNKIDSLALQTINNKLNKLNVKSKNFQRHSSSFILNKKQSAKKVNYGLQVLKDKQDLNKSANEVSIIEHNDEQSNSQQLGRLNRQYGHLQEQISKYALDGSEANIEKIIQTLDEGCLQVSKAIKQRRKEISQLNYSILINSKQLQVVEKQQNVEAACDNVDQIRGMIYKANKKNKENEEKLANIYQKNNQLQSKLRQVQNTKDDVSIKSPESTKLTISTSVQSTLTTPKNSMKLLKSFKIKNTTTLDLEGQHQYLLRKKDILLKSIEAQNRKWKAIYTSKMKKLVHEYSNFKQIQMIQEKQQQRRSTKLQQIQNLKYKHCLTEL